MLLFFPFTGEETEDRGGEGTFPRAHAGDKSILSLIPNKIKLSLVTGEKLSDTFMAA